MHCFSAKAISFLLFQMEHPVSLLSDYYGPSSDYSVKMKIKNIFVLKLKSGKTIII